MSVEIHYYSEDYADDLINMVIGIQRDEFGFPVTLEQQPDLIDVIGHYSSGQGGFWIALDNKKLVGSIGLLDLGAGAILFA